MHTRSAVGLLAASAALACAGTACRREQRQFRTTMNGNVQPAPGASAPYSGSAWGMSEGQRLYTQMNCVGCHAHGGGAMGPALMDGKWIYGFDDSSIFSTIVNGRPNGMPAYRARLSDDQVWQLVVYVKSLGGNESTAAASVRDDHMALTPGPARTTPEPITRQQP